MNIEIEAEMLRHSPRNHRVTRWQNESSPGPFDYQTYALKSSIRLFFAFPGFTSLHSTYYKKNILYLYLFIVCI